MEKIKGLVMWETIRMFIGFLFSLGIIGVSIYKNNKGWLITSIIALLGAIIFLGQFIAKIKG